MARTGLVVKIQHKGQKCYAVVKEDKGATVVLVFPYGAAMEEIEVPKKKVRQVEDVQSLSSFTLLRQIVGIPLEEPKPKPTIIGKVEKKLAKDKPASAPVNEEFTITHPDVNDGQPTPISQVNDPTGMLQAIKENLQKFAPQVKSIKWADDKPDTPEVE